MLYIILLFFFFFQAEDGIRDADVTGVQTCALPISKVAMNLPLPTITFGILTISEPRKGLEAGEFTSNNLVCLDRKSTRLNSSHVRISYAVFCLKKKKKNKIQIP